MHCSGLIAKHLALSTKFRARGIIEIPILLAIVALIAASAALFALEGTPPLVSSLNASPCVNGDPGTVKFSWSKEKDGYNYKLWWDGSGGTIDVGDVSEKVQSGFTPSDSAIIWQIKAVDPSTGEEGPTAIGGNFTPKCATAEQSAVQTTETLTLELDANEKYSGPNYPFNTPGIEVKDGCVDQNGIYSAGIEFKYGSNAPDSANPQYRLEWTFGSKNYSYPEGTNTYVSLADNTKKGIIDVGWTPGKYKITLKAKADGYADADKVKDFTAKDCTPTIAPATPTNNRPTNPTTPSGPTTVNQNSTQTYSVTSSDSDNHKIRVDFQILKPGGGDAQIVNGPTSTNGCLNGCTLSLNYTFSDVGQYYIAATAYDELGLQSAGLINRLTVVSGIVAPSNLQVSEITKTPPCKVNFSWTNASQGANWDIQLSNDNFASISTKDLSSGLTTTTAPDGFAGTTGVNPPTSLVPGNTYQWRMWYGVSNTFVNGQNFTISQCQNPVTNTKPSVPTNITSPANNNVTGIYDISAQASDPDNNKLFIKFAVRDTTGTTKYIDSAMTTSGCSSPCTRTIGEGFWIPGGYTINAIAYDEHGAMSTGWSPNYTITIPQPVTDNAAFDRQWDVPTTMTVGQTATVNVQMKNTGNNTWTAGTGTGSYRLGSQNLQDNTTWGINRVNLKGNVPTDGIPTFNFNITAPTTPGTYNFQWQMLKEGTGWFGAKSTNIAIAVNAIPIPANLTVSGLPTTCVSAPYSVTLNWTNSNSNWVLDISKDNFVNFSNKNIPNLTTTTGPGGFTPAFTLDPGVTYQWRIWNGKTHAVATQNITSTKCATPTPIINSFTPNKDTNESDKAGNTVVNGCMTSGTPGKAAIDFIWSATNATGYYLTWDFDHNGSEEPGYPISDTITGNSVVNSGWEPNTDYTATLHAVNGTVEAKETRTFKTNNCPVPPTVRISDPKEGDNRYGVVEVWVDAQHSAGINAVELYIDNNYIDASTAKNSQGYNVLRWDTKNYALGSHIVRAVAYQSDTNSNSASVNVNVVAVPAAPPIDESSTDNPPITDTNNGEIQIKIHFVNQNGVEYQKDIGQRVQLYKNDDFLEETVGYGSPQYLPHSNNGPGLYRLVAQTINDYSILNTFCLNQLCKSNFNYQVGNSVVVNLQHNNDYSDVYFEYSPNLTAVNCQPAPPTKTPEGILDTRQSSSDFIFTWGTFNKDDWGTECQTKGPRHFEAYFGNTNPPPRAPQYDTNATNQGFLLSNLQLNTTYYVKVAAVNQEGLRSEGKVVKIVTDQPESDVKFMGKAIDVNGNEIISPDVLNKYVITYPNGETYNRQDSSWFYGGLSPGQYKIFIPSSSGYRTEYALSYDTTKPPENFTSGNSLTLDLDTLGKTANLVIKFIPDSSSIDQPSTDLTFNRTTSDTPQVYDLVNFDISAQNADGFLIHYLVDWGDGTSATFLPNNLPGKTVRVSHAWVKAGHYSVTASLANEAKEQKVSIEIDVQENQAITCKNVAVNGDPANKLNLTFVPVNYQNNEMDQFEKDIQSMIAKDTGLFHYKPFSDNEQKFNVYKVEKSISAQSDEELASGAVKNTIQAVANACPGGHIGVAVKHLGYRGFAWPDAKMAFVSTDNAGSLGFVFSHEFGHAFGQLADEYVYDLLSGGAGGIRVAGALNCWPSKDSPPWKDYPGTSSFPGCSDAEWYRPTNNSVMHGDGQEARKDENGFDPWNIKLLKDIIDSGPK